MSVSSENSDLPLTVAILGAGQVAQQHARAFAQIGHSVRLAGIADINAERAHELASAYNTRAFTDYRDLLTVEPDIAVICLPHHLHREAGVVSASAGCHVLMEKPLAHTVEDARDILAACHEHDVCITLSFVHRYRSELQHASRIVADGGIGTPATALDNFCSQGGPHVPEWVWKKREAGGGVLMYGGIHSIDRLRWLVSSEVREVFARTTTYSQNVDVEDGLIATLVFENGCLATLFENSPGYRVTPRNWDTELYGSDGCIRLRTREYLEFSSETQAYRFNVVRDDNFGDQARELVAAIREDRQPWVTGEDGLRALEIATAIYRSAEQHQPISLADIRAE